MNDWLERIKYVVDNSQHVSINESILEEFSGSIAAVRTDWQASSPVDFSEFSFSDTLAKTLVFNAVNFSYWGDPKWTIEYQGKLLDGSWAMLGSLKRAIDEGLLVFDPGYLAKLNLETGKHIFRGNIELPLLQERVAHLNELGSVVQNHYEGDFLNLVSSGENNALGLVNLLVRELPTFDDSSSYRGEEIFFHKRAQLAVSDIHEALISAGKNGLENMDSLIAFADYKIPQIMRSTGMLVYSSRLANTVDSGEELPPHSEEEIEIRANMIWTVELMKPYFPELNAAEIDHKLWLSSQRKALNHPYHKTRTTAY